MDYLDRLRPGDLVVYASKGGWMNKGILLSFSGAKCQRANLYSLTYGKKHPLQSSQFDKRLWKITEDQLTPKEQKEYANYRQQRGLHP